MLKILNIVHTLNLSGVAAVIYNNYQFMDHDRIQFTIISQRGKGHSGKIDFFEKKFRDMGVKIYFVPVKSENLTGNLRQTKKIMQENHFDAVHIHMEEGAATYVVLASVCGIKTRIVHAHLAYPNRSALEKMRNVLLKTIVNKFVTDRFACGILAAESMWGKERVGKGEVTIINNAVDTERFHFDPLIRKRKRQELNVDSRFVIGNVARMESQKNHTFLLTIFKDILKRDDNCILVLVGTRSLSDELKRQAADLGIEKEVMFLGERDDIAELMQAFDVFVLTSLFEGLPIVGIEAQSVGLPCVFSDNITELVNVTNNCIFLNLKDPGGLWIDGILQYKQEERRNTRKKLIQSGYDLRVEAHKLENKYFEIMEKKHG